MTDEEIRRAIREELAVALSGFLRGLLPPVVNRGRIDATLSAKRAAASKVRWGASVPGSRVTRLNAARRNGTHTEQEWYGLLEILDYRCVACGATGVAKDHIRPIRLLGSSDSIDNIQPMCRPCSAAKGADVIDRRPPDWRMKLDQWAMQNHSIECEPNADETRIYVKHVHSKITPKRARPKERLSTDLFTEPSEPGRDESAMDVQAPSSRVFLAYAGAYRMRYGEFPVRNAKVNRLLVELVKRLGADAAPVAEHYLTIGDKLYGGSGHAIALLVRDCEKLHTMWRQGATSGGDGPATPGKPWWEVWSLIEQQGADLGIDPDENPQRYRAAVLRAAYAAGRLPEPVAAQLGVLGKRPG